MTYMTSHAISYNDRQHVSCITSSTYCVAAFCDMIALRDGVTNVVIDGIWDMTCDVDVSVDVDVSNNEASGSSSCDVVV